MTSVKFSRRRFLHLAAGAAALPAMSRIAQAQAYPSRPVRVIVPFPAGGVTDLVARLMGQWLSERLGRQFIIENRPGGSANIGTEAVVRAPADGYTLLTVGVFNTINASLHDKLNYNFLRDIVPIGTTASFPNVIEVNLSLPVHTIPELIAYAKANPGKINMGTGTGTSQHLTGELFKMMANVDIVRVPYLGGAPALIDLIGGQVQMVVDALPGSLEQIKAGKVRALAVTTAARFDAMPELPTVGEFLPGFEATGWNGMGAPRNTPPEIVETLSRTLRAAGADPKIKARLAELGGTPLSMGASDFGKSLADETEKWGKVVKFANIKVE